MDVPQVCLARRLDAVRARLGVWEADDAGVAAHAVEVPAAHAALKHTQHSEKGMFLYRRLRESHLLLNTSYIREWPVSVSHLRQMLH